MGLVWSEPAGHALDRPYHALNHEFAVEDPALMSKPTCRLCLGAGTTTGSPPSLRGPWAFRRHGPESRGLTAQRLYDSTGATKEGSLVYYNNGRCRERITIPAEEPVKEKPPSTERRKVERVPPPKTKESKTQAFSNIVQDDISMIIATTSKGRVRLEPGLCHLEHAYKFKRLITLSA